MSAQCRVDALCRLTESPAQHWSRYPSVICDLAGNYCTAWYRYPPPASGVPCEIQICKGTDRLDSIARHASVQVTGDARNHTGPTLCQSGGGEYWLAWHCWPQREGPRFILVAHSGDGLTWSRPSQPFPQIAQYMIYPSLASHPAGRLWIAFSAGLGEHSRIYLSSSQGRESWRAPVPAPVGTSGDDKGSLAIDSTGRFVMAWRHLEERGRHRLCWSESDNGTRWRDAQEIATAVDDVERPKLALDKERRVWLSYESHGAIWLCHLAPDRHWSVPMPVRLGTGIESRPSALVQNQAGEYWLAWTSQRDGTELWGARISFPAGSR